MSQQPGLHSFCWVELAAGDAQAAKNFYQGLFNWTYSEQSLPEEMGGNYIVAMVGADSAGAMFTMPQEMRAMHIPPHWGSYVLVENVDEMVKKAQSLGATIIKDAFDCMDAGRMAVIKDPCGAVFQLWQKNRVTGASVRREAHGGVCWQELMVADPNKALEFYTKLFGWSYETSQFDQVTYNSLKSADGQPFGGIMALPKDMPTIPPHWGVYFTVANLNEGIDYVKKNGGNIVVGPQDVHGMGEFAICIDPQGAAFAIFEFKQQ